MRAKFSLPTICVAIAALVVQTSTKASSITIQAGDPLLPGVASAEWRSPRGAVVHNLQMPAQDLMTSSAMAAVTAARLRSIPGVDPASVTLAGNQVHVNSTPLHDPLDGVMPGGPISWSTGTTAQASMKLLTPEINNANITAAGHFDPFFQPGQPAIFTAGIVTDVGELTVQVSAQELNFQTDGPIICEALFQRLAPLAPQYGAHVSYGDDNLHFYFHPAYTYNQGGIVFGTTSPSQGFSGQILTHPEGTPYDDNNQDGVYDAADYVAIRKLGDSPYYGFERWRYHFGQPAQIFTTTGAPSSRAVPEPANLVLILIGTLAIAARRRNASANQRFAT